MKSRDLVGEMIVVWRAGNVLVDIMMHGYNQLVIVATFEINMKS